MTESTVKEALLRQNGGPSLEAELNMLNTLMEAEARRARRLKRWAIAVWVVWLAVVVLLFGGYALLRVRAPQAPAPVQGEAPAGQAAPNESHSLISAVSVTVVILLFACLAGLPIIGVIFLILLLLSPRSATVMQLQTGLSALDTQLRSLAGAQKKTADGPPH